MAFVGRLVPYKGADMLVEAAAPLVRSGRVVLDIVGDEPEMPALRQQTACLGLEHAVGLDGWVNHRTLAPRLAQSQVFAFPSVREFGGGAVLEAMALGLAPVVVDYAGPGELVTDETGFRIPMGPRASVVARLHEVLAELARHPERATALGQRARSRSASGSLGTPRPGRSPSVLRVGPGPPWPGGPGPAIPRCAPRCAALASWRQLPADSRKSARSLPASRRAS